MSPEKTQAVVAHLITTPVKEADTDYQGATTISVMGMFGDDIVVGIQAGRASRTFRMPVVGALSPNSIRYYPDITSQPVPLSQLSDGEVDDALFFLDRAIAPHAQIVFDNEWTKSHMLVEEGATISPISKAPSQRRWARQQVMRMSGQYVNADQRSVYGLVARGLRRTFP